MKFNLAEYFSHRCLRHCIASRTYCTWLRVTCKTDEKFNAINSVNLSTSASAVIQSRGEWREQESRLVLGRLVLKENGNLVGDSVSECGKKT